MSESDASKREADALFDMLKQRYGHWLVPEELEEVRKGVEGIVEAAEALRAVKLGSNDEPFLLFAPYRNEGRGHDQ